MVIIYFSMTQQFLYEKFKHYNQEKLFEIGFNEENYKPEIVQLAKQIITENGWQEIFEKELAEIKKKKKEEEERYEIEIEEKADYYKDVVEFRNEGNSFQVRIADIPKLEASLHEHEIEFFREDKHIGVQLDAYPTQTYFFRTKDIEKVDNITKELQINTAPYADLLPFAKFEGIAIIIIIIAILLVLCIPLRF
jgi:ABC-type antimicrobial peptide transport system permease subunit